MAIIIGFYYINILEFWNVSFFSDNILIVDGLEYIYIYNINSYKMHAFINTLHIIYT